MDFEGCRKRYGEIVDAMPINILMVNKKLIVTYSNRMFKETFRKSYIKTLEKGPGDLLSCTNSRETEEGCGHSSKCGECSIRKYLSSVVSKENAGNSIEVSLTVEGAFGEEKKWFEIKAIPFPMEEELYLITFSDISVYKMDNYDLLQHQRLAEAANKAKSEFLANMSHEIRTPLNGLIGMLEMTLLTELTEEQRENLEVAKNCADTLLNLINNILDLSKIESNKVVLDEAPFNVRDLIQKVIDIQTAKVLEKDLKVECKIDEKMPSDFCGDAFRLQRVLTNLLSNAVKFTERGRIELEIKTLCSFGDIYTLAFSVEDEGIGLSPSEMSGLFQPFNQVDGSITRKYGGSGLGLAISQSIVNLMGGEIKVKSQKGRGSVFFFTIQMRTTKTPAKEEVKPIFLEGKNNQSKLLLVEDDKYSRVVTSQMLAKLGYQNLDFAVTGFEAIQKAGKKDYDAILMDIQLPEMDGMETVEIIREKEKNSLRRVPIIAVTAHALKGDREKFMEKGMDDYVTKPINIWALEKALMKIRNQEKFLETENDVDIKEVYDFWKPGSSKSGEQMKLPASDHRAVTLQLEKILQVLNQASKNAADYVKIEKAAHELKLKAQRKEYDHIKIGAFRIELAARKKDEQEIKKAYGQLKKMMNEQWEGERV